MTQVTILSFRALARNLLCANPRFLLAEFILTGEAAPKGPSKLQNRG
jgi:hypothetical protein